MIVQYNKLNRLEQPKFTLCSPGSIYVDGLLTNVVGILTDHEAEEVVYNFNATSELNFRLNLIRREGFEDSDVNIHTMQMFKAVQNRRLIFLDDIGFFMITNIEDGYSDGKRFKDVKAQSIDIEIQQKMIPYIPDGTYPFSTTGENKGILETIVEVLPMWTIGTVDTVVSERWRTFEDVDTSLNCLGFLLENVQDAYECIVVFDIINRTINVYDQANYVRLTDIHITKDDVINTLDITENAEDLYTAISVLGDENVTIGAINPLGSNTIYDFSYYLDWMTPALSAKVAAWQAAVAAAADPEPENSYYNLNLEYYQKLAEASNIQAEVRKLETQLTMYQRCRDNIVAESTNTSTSEYLTVNNQIATLSHYAVGDAGAEIESVHTVDANDTPITRINQASSLSDGYFTYTADSKRLTFYSNIADGTRIFVVYKYLGSGNINANIRAYNTVIVNNGGTAIEILAEVAELLGEIDGLIATCEGALDTQNALLEAANAELEALQTSISAIRESLRITEYFTQEEYAELCNYIFEGSYTDDYVVITDIMSYEDKFAQMKILYDRAKTRLEKVSQPTQEFDVDAESFLFAKDFEHWSNQLETGCLINVELEEDDIALLFLSNITVNYDDHKLTMTFGNRFNKFDPKSLFDDVLGDISKSANTLNYIKDILYPIKNGELNAMREALQTSRDLTMADALASVDEEVVIDGSGYTGKKKLDNGTYDPRQIKITGRNIVFTDDAWETCKVAIGELIFGDGSSIYGINAQAVIGDIIMGNNLRILDNNGNDILTVVDGRIEAEISGLSDEIDTLQESVSVMVTQDQLNIAISNISVHEVETTTGYRFDADGLHISTTGDGSDITNLIDHTGMKVQRSGAGSDGSEQEDILVANNEGVNALNLTARQYLIIGLNSRFEDYSNGTDSNRTACFYIGEEGE